MKFIMRERLETWSVAEALDRRHRLGERTATGMVGGGAAACGEGYKALKKGKEKEK